MRLVFAAMVLLSHSAEIVFGNRSHEPLTQLFHTISFGELGVDGFFILSGFMIAGSWERDPRWVSFLKKRVLRIYPGFMVAYLVSALIAGTIGAVSAYLYLADMNWIALTEGLFSLAYPRTPPTFTASYYPVVNGSLWSIRQEFLCYLLILAIGSAGILARTRVTVCLWLASLALFVAFRVHHGSQTPGAVGGGQAIVFMRMLPMFLAGTAIYKTGIYKRRTPAMIVAALLLLLASLCVSVLAELGIATVGAYLLFVVGFTPLRHPEARRFPDISYGVYLYGWPVQQVILVAWPTAPYLAVFALALALAGSMVLGTLSWFAVEKPALALKRLSWPPRRTALVSTS